MNIFPFMSGFPYLVTEIYFKITEFSDENGMCCNLKLNINTDGIESWEIVGAWRNNGWTDVVSQFRQQ